MTKEIITDRIVDKKAFMKILEEYKKEVKYSCPFPTLLNLNILDIPPMRMGVTFSAEELEKLKSDCKKAIAEEAYIIIDSFPNYIEEEES